MREIILTTTSCKNYPHFIHYMQYLYWCTDIILNDTDFKYIIIEPKNKSNGRYVKSYLLFTSFCKIAPKLPVPYPKIGFFKILLTDSFTKRILRFISFRLDFIP